jgi:hypothetical protein
VPLVLGRRASAGFPCAQGEPARRGALSLPRAGAPVAEGSVDGEGGSEPRAPLFTEAAFSRSLARLWVRIR